MAGQTKELILPPKGIEETLMIPQWALVYSANQKGRKGFVERMDIVNGVLCNPMHLTPQNVRGLKAALDNTSSGQFNGLIPPRTHYVSGSIMAFSTPVGWRDLMFGTDKNVRRIWVPDCLFVYEGPEHRLAVYWWNGKNMDKLVGAALPNLSNGSVCLGSSMRTFKYTTDIAKMQERILHGFFHSVFNEWREETIAPILKSLEPGGEGTINYSKKFWGKPSEALQQHIKNNRWQTLQQVLTAFTGRTSNY